MTDADVKGHTAIVIDVLRTSSTIVTALNEGARAIIPVADMAEAGKMAANLDQSTYLMGGERGGEKIEGYHLGNSPKDYRREIIADRTIILNTTNGTPALTHARAAAHLVVGCFLNASRVVEFAREKDLDVALICAGWRNRIALEDTLCAGLILHQLWEGKEPAFISDSAHIAFSLYLHDKAHLLEAIQNCNHALRLREYDYGEDVIFCTQHDLLPVLPYYKDSQLVLYTALEEDTPSFSASAVPADDPEP